MRVNEYLISLSFLDKPSPWMTSFKKSNRGEQNKEKEVTQRGVAQTSREDLSSHAHRSADLQGATAFSSWVKIYRVLKTADLTFLGGPGSIPDMEIPDRRDSETVPPTRWSVSIRCHTVLQGSGNGAEVPQIQAWFDGGPQGPGTDPLEQKVVEMCKKFEIYLFF